jgi:hypothetical protein
MDQIILNGTEVRIEITKTDKGWRLSLIDLDSQLRFPVIITYPTLGAAMAYADKCLKV